LGEKLVRRHPHVFGDQVAADAQQALASWEQIKQAERRAKGKERSSLLGRVPRSLPALAAAQALGERAATVGFDWETLRGVFDKLREELDELRRAETPVERAEELGDVLFVLARVGSWMDVDVEDALRRANRKFGARFGAMEAAARRDGVELASLSADEWDRLWNEAKRTT
jgi:MazG family protein